MPRRMLPATIESKTKQIYSLLREQIFQGVYAAGVKLPRRGIWQTNSAYRGHSSWTCMNSSSPKGTWRAVKALAAMLLIWAEANDNSLLSSKKSILPVKRLLRNPLPASKALIFALVFRLWSISLSRNGRKPPLPHMQLLM